MVHKEKISVNVIFKHDTRQTHESKHITYAKLTKPFSGNIPCALDFPFDPQLKRIQRLLGDVRLAVDLLEFGDLSVNVRYRFAVPLEELAEGDHKNNLVY